MPLKKEENEKRFRSFFNGAEGDFVLEQIDILCGYNQTTFHVDPYQHAFGAGQRNAAVVIHELLERKEKEKEK